MTTTTQSLEKLGAFLSQVSDLPDAALLWDEVRQRCISVGEVRQVAAILERYAAALEVIAKEQHEEGCKFAFTPIDECPACESAASIARATLQTNP